MEGSETGCGRVWTGVRMEDGGERDGVWTGVDGGEDGRWRERDGRVWTTVYGGSETGCGRVWMVVWKVDGGERDGVWTGVDGGLEEDGGERDGVWTGVDGGVEGRWREDGCGRW